MLSYSNHFETIVALVTHLALATGNDGKSDDSNAMRLAAHLGLDPAETVEVLDNLKGLFRRSHETFASSSGPQHRYSLQLRYARRTYQESELVQASKPLSNDDLFSLLTFVIDKVREEQENQRLSQSNRTTMVGAWIAATMALIAALASLAN